MEDVSGRDLDWFWRGWFFTTGALDQAVDTVAQRTDRQGAQSVTVTLRNAGYLVMPVELQLTFADGTTASYSYPVEIWYKGDTYKATIPVTQPVTEATVNPDGSWPDIVPGNNSWKAGS